MHTLDLPCDPGGRTPRERLRALCRSLEELAARLREGVARAVSTAVAEAVHDIVRELWGRLVAAPAPLPPVPAGGRPPSPSQAPENDEEWQRFGPYREEEGLFMPDREDHPFLSDEPEGEPDPAPDPKSPETVGASCPRWPEAVAVGLHACACWLRRGRNPRSLWAALGVVLTSALGSYVLGPPAAAAVALAASALTLGKVIRLAGKVKPFPAAGS